MSGLNLVKASLRDVVHALQSGRCTSEDLVKEYLGESHNLIVTNNSSDRIDTDNLHGRGLRAVLQIAPRDKGRT